VLTDYRVRPGTASPALLEDSRFVLEAP
jgi:hypothetical protein